MPFVITVQFTPQAVRAVGSDNSAADETEINEILRGLSLEFHQNDPLADDEELKSYFSTVIDDEVRANKIVERLMLLSFVLGAYMKPVDAPPE